MHDASQLEPTGLLTVDAFDGDGDVRAGSTSTSNSVKVTDFELRSC